MRLRQVERCLDSGMPIGERCRPNKVSSSTLYVRLKVYREESHGQAKSNGDRIGLARQEVKGSKALAVESSGVFANNNDDDKQGGAPFGSNAAMQVSLNGAGILIPSGCGGAAIESALSAVAAL